MQEPQQPGKILRWVKAELRRPVSQMDVYIRYDNGEQKEVGNRDKMLDLIENGWLNVEWFEETEELSAPASPVEEKGFYCALPKKNCISQCAGCAVDLPGDGYSPVENMPQTENPQASYWFEKARQNLVERNDFKAQLSRANDKIKELTESRPSPVIEIGEQKREFLQMGYELSAESDVAAIEYGKLCDQFIGERAYDCSHIAEAHEQGQIWMYRKLTNPTAPNTAEKKNKYPIGGYAPGSYSCHCVTCKENFTGDKRAVQCERCATKMAEEEEQEQEITLNSLNDKSVASHPAPAPIVGKRGNPIELEEVVVEALAAYNALPPDVSIGIGYKGWKGGYLAAYQKLSGNTTPPNQFSLYRAGST